MTIIHADCLDAMAAMDADSVDAIVCDPPYGLSFMGKQWDHGVPGVPFWTEALRVAKPGAHLVAFGGTRTYHRLACAIEDAGWEIRDCLSWLYGSGFPKSLDVSKAMDKRGGDALAWRTFSAAYAQAVEASAYTHSDIDRALGIKSSSCYWARTDHRGGMPPRQHWESVRELLGLPDSFVSLYDEAEREVVGEQTKARSVGGASALPTMGAGVEYKTWDITAPATDLARQWQGWGTALKPAWEPIILARKPLIGTVAANVAAHGTGGINIDACRIEGAPPSVPQPDFRSVSGRATSLDATRRNGEMSQASGRWPANVCLDEAAASGFPESRYFYVAKASRREREAGLEGMERKEASARNAMTGLPDLRMEREQQRIPAANHHPTVKPIALMRWLCRLVTPPNGLILDPFTGSGTTGCAAVLEGFRFVGVEREAEYVAIAEKRIAHWAGQRTVPEPDLFGDAA